MTEAAELAARRDVLRRMPDLGSTVIDTAPAYGRSEGVIGQRLGELKNRDRMWLATKVTAPEGRVATGARCSRSRSAGCAPAPPAGPGPQPQRVREMLPVLREQKKAGRVSYVGVTTSRDAQYDDLLEVIRRDTLDFIQVDYSIADRNAAKKILPLAASRGTAVLVNLPLGRGNVKSKVKGRPLPDWAEQVDATCFPQRFLKYVVSHPAVTVAIPGTTKVGHSRTTSAPRAAASRTPTCAAASRPLRRAVVHNACAHAIVRHDAHRSSREDV